MKMLHLPEFHGLESVAHAHLSVAKLFFLYAMPLSIIPPLMLYYAGTMYGGKELLLEFTNPQLQTIGVVFFVTEIIMLFTMAAIIRRISGVIELHTSFEDAFKLAVIAPTPLWLAPLFLFIPSFLLNLTVGALALMATGVLIYYSVPSILKVEEKGHAMLLSGWICTAGMVAWAAMMYLTLLTWNAVTSSLPL